MNYTIIYHGAWLVFSILAVILGALTFLNAGFTIGAALLVVLGLLFGARSVHALFLTEETEEVAAWQAYLAIAVLAMLIAVIVIDLVV